MPKKMYHVLLTTEQRKLLSELISAGKAPARTLAHARIMLKADIGPEGPGWGDAAIAEAVEVSTATVGKVRQRFAEQDIQTALYRRKPNREYRRKLDGGQEAHLVALTCQSPPDGHERWTVRLLAGKMVELEYTDTVSYETVRRTLKKNRLKPWRIESWCIPPKQNAQFVYRMEDVLSVYERAYNPVRPLVCMDEISVQLLDHVKGREPMLVQPGHIAKQDYEYKRKGTANIFLDFEPLAGKRHADVTERRTRVDWAQWAKNLVDERYPKAECIVLVMDNLNVHSPASLYEAFPPQEAKRIADKLEIHHTPKHGNLSMAVG